MRIEKSMGKSDPFCPPPLISGRSSNINDHDVIIKSERTLRLISKIRLWLSKIVLYNNLDINVFLLCEKNYITSVGVTSNRLYLPIYYCIEFKPGYIIT